MKRKVYVGGVYDHVPAVVSPFLEKTIDYLQGMVIPHYGQADYDEAYDITWTCRLVDGWFLRLEATARPHGERLYIEQMTIEDKDLDGEA